MKIQIAENIKKYRVRLGLTQTDLAVLLSVSPQAVSRWESDRAFPDITLLPLLAKYLNVSIDELMGVEGQQNKSLKKELYERRRAVIDDDAEKRNNEIRILEILEELSQAEYIYLDNYFERLMALKNSEAINIPGLEERMVRVRQMLRDRMHQSGMRERIRLLGAVATHEDRDKLELWADEYELPEEMRTNFWDEMLLSRYKQEKNVEKIDAQYQKILYAHVNNTVYYLTDGLSYDMKLKKMGKDFADPEPYRLALDTLSLYSGRVDDIFIFTRIIAQVRYAEALLINGYGEESLAAFALAAEYLSVLHQLPQGCLLSGSVPVLDSVRFTVDVRDKLKKCVFFIGNYDTDPLFDTIRKDKRFVAYTASLEQFFPQRESRSWVNELGSDEIDASWEMLFRRASKEADQLSDGNVVVILTEKGTVDSISFQNTDAAIDAEGAMRFLVDKKKSGDTRIERLVCMWHDGSIDLPSFAFREALVAVDSKNLSAQMLLPGLMGFVIKTVKATMPKGYRA